MTIEEALVATSIFMSIRKSKILTILMRVTVFSCTIKHNEI